MENREEIKDGVKQRIIDFMAEQITREESFANLKAELITELFAKKTVTTKVVNESSQDLDTFTVVAAKAEDSLQKIKDRQAEYYKKIIDVKIGKGTNENVQRLIRQLNDSDSTTYSDVIEQLDGKKMMDYKEFIIDPTLKGDLTEEKKQNLRNLSLSALKKKLEHPFTGTLEIDVLCQTNEGNYYKSYMAHDKIENFTFKCSYVYNEFTKNKHIDSFYVDSKGFLLTGNDLGIPFAIEAMNLIDEAEIVRQKAIDMVEKSNKRKAARIKPTRKEKPGTAKPRIKK